jgi:hypothetical protein
LSREIRRERACQEAPPKELNLAARALRDPKFRPKDVVDPFAYNRRARFNKKPDDSSDE